MSRRRNNWKMHVRHGEARIPWEQSEGFFGPVDSKGIDPSIDSTVNVEDLNAVLNSKDSLTKEYVDLLKEH